MHWQVVFADEARQEFSQLPAREQSAMIHALDKITAEGPALRLPHSSAVQGADRLRELRLRAGRSAWRALYRRVGEVFVITARSGQRHRRTSAALDEQLPRRRLGST